VLGFNLSFFADETAFIRAFLKQIGDWVEQGRVSAPPVKAFRLEQVSEAHSWIQTGQSIGKLVLTTNVAK